MKRFLALFTLCAAVQTSAQPVDVCKVFDFLPQCAQKFSAAYSIGFAQPNALPPCSLAISGAYDATCVFQCLPYGDGGINCYDNTGAPLGTMTQPSSPSPVLSNSPIRFADGGWAQQWEFPNDTAGTTGLAHVLSTTIQNFFASPHTLIYEGYMGSTGPDPTGWFFGGGNNSNQVELRRAGPNSIQFLETPNVATSGGECLDFWCTIMAKREADGGINVNQGGNKSATVGTTMTALTSLQTLDLGGYFNTLCCSPQGSQGGALGSVTGYGPDGNGQAKDDSFYEYVNKSAFGALALASGSGTQVGNLGLKLARYDLDKPGGGLPVLGPGDYMMDSVAGTVTNQTYHVLGPVDSLDGGALVGSCTWRPKFDKGPMYSWKHQNSAGVLSSDDGGICGMVLGSIGGDAGYLDTNAYVIATAFTDGGYAVSGSYWIQNYCPSGTASVDHCAGAVSSWASYPRYGCSSVCSGSNGTVQSILYLGNDAGQTAALEIQLVQMTDTLEWEEPSVTNAQNSAQYLEVDAGVANAALKADGGCNPGKICVVYQTMYSTSTYPTPLVSSQPPGTGSYLYDMSNPATGATHDLLQWLTTEQQADGGTVPTLDGLMYGNDPNYIVPNKFSSGGQYNGAPISSTAGVYAVTCLSWNVETGKLPDGGVGQGSRLIETANVCADQTHPMACTDSVVVNQNTGQLGLCPGMPTVFEVGTRAGGSGPSTTRDHHISICSCKGKKCKGACK